MQQALFISPLLLSALIFNLYLVQVLSRLLTRASDSCSSSAIKSTKLLSSGDSSAAYASLMFFESIRHNSDRSWSGGWGGYGAGKNAFFHNSNCCSEQFFQSASHLSSTQTMMVDNQDTCMYFLLWIPVIFHRICSKYQQFHECVARVNCLYFQHMRWKNFGIYKKKKSKFSCCFSI